MPTLQPLLLTATVLLVGVCLRVCARTYARHRAALPSEQTMTRLRRAVSGAETTSRRHAEDAVSSVERLEERILREVLTAPTRSAGVLALNELTGEVMHALQDARTLPPAVGRVALLGGTALGLTAIATALRNGQGGTAAVWGGACLVLGVVGAGACGVYGRLTRRAAERRRDRARELVRLLERRLPTA